LPCIGVYIYIYIYIYIYKILLFTTAVNVLGPFGIKLFPSIVFCMLVPYFCLLVRSLVWPWGTLFLFGIRRVYQIFCCQSGVHVVLTLTVAHRIEIVSAYWMIYCTYNLLNMFRALMCPSSGARDYTCVIAAYGAKCLGCWWSAVRCRAAVMRPGWGKLFH
jgi:hypothetical protein